MRDLYAILGVQRSATQGDIKKAYRRMAKNLHPDTNPGDKKVADKFKEVSAAYSILGNDKNRMRYDRGEIDENGSPKSTGGWSGYTKKQSRKGYDNSAFGYNFGDEEDLFEEFFGAKKTRKRSGGDAFKRPKRRGLDIGYDITVDFEKSVLGGKSRLKLNDGRSMEIKIPVGIRDGQVIRLSGQGGPGFAGGEKGDALVEIRVADHAVYARKDDDIYMDVPISVDEAILGGDIQVPTPHGRLTVRVPRGTSSGKKLRLKGKGVRKADKQGNLYMTLQVMLPENRDSELENLIKQWGKGNGPELRKKRGLDKG